MINEVLTIMRDQLNEFLNARSGYGLPESGEDRVVLLDGEKMDPISFKTSAITALLINLEEENILRSADVYRRPLPDGTSLAVNPAIRLNLYVLFVARYKQYEEGLHLLSLIIRYFQQNRVLDHQNAPNLSPAIDKLVIELVTLPFAEQNEIWNALRTTYHPSVLYKASLIVFSDEDGVALPPTTLLSSRWAK